MYKVIGLRVEKYLGTTCEGHNCDFVYGKEERDRHVLLLKHVEDGHNVELTLSWEEDQCGSGCCCSTEAFYDWQEVDTFAGRNYSPIKDLFVDVSEQKLNNLDEDSFNCDVFYFSPVGGDSYYPSGSYEINIELFSPSSD